MKIIWLSLGLMAAVKQSHDTGLYAANILMITVEHTFWKFFFLLQTATS